MSKCILTVLLAATWLPLRNLIAQEPDTADTKSVGSGKASRDKSAGLETTIYTPTEQRARALSFLRTFDTPAEVIVPAQPNEEVTGAQ